VAGTSGSKPLKWKNASGLPFTVKPASARSTRARVQAPGTDVAARIAQGRHATEERRGQVEPFLVALVAPLGAT
jgi:hypothetical protein